jgi:hypothetical protein
VESVIIEVELFGQLEIDLPRLHRIEMGNQSTVKQAALNLGINLNKVGMITINGILSDEPDILTGNCRLCFFPYLSGG